MTAEILDTDAVCTLSDLMFPQPLNEASTVHVAACIVAAFEQLHQRSIVFRGLTPSTVAVDANGLAQLVDVRCASSEVSIKCFFGAVQMQIWIQLQAS